jgi:hypothetical protein
MPRQPDVLQAAAAIATVKHLSFLPGIRNGLIENQIRRTGKIIGSRHQLKTGRISA